MPGLRWWLKAIAQTGWSARPRDNTWWEKRKRMHVDGEALKRQAEALEACLWEHKADDHAVGGCIRALQPYIEKAKARKVVKPIRNLPCGYDMHEGSLRRFPDIEEAYSAFACTITGVDLGDVTDWYHVTCPDHPSPTRKHGYDD